jgi:hypothetical protein
VKNQQGSVSELLQTKARLRNALPNFSQSRDELSCESAERSARLAQTAKQFASSRRRRRSAGEARRQTRVSHRDREKSVGFGSGSVANRQKWKNRTFEFLTVYMEIAL